MSNNLHELKLHAGITVYQDYLPGIQPGKNILCPFHDDKKTKSFGIFFTESEEYRFKCFGCGESGDIIDFIQRIEGITQSEAIQKLKYRFNGGNGSSEGQPKDSLFSIEQIKKFVLKGGYIYNRHHLYDASESIYIKVIYKDNAGNNTALFYHLVGNDKWQKGIGGEAVLYNQRALQERSYDIVLYCEGEKDADTLTILDYLSVTAGGATAFKPSMAEKLRNRDVVLFSDNDESGYRGMDTVARYLSPIAQSVRIADLLAAWQRLFHEEMPEKADVTDLVEKYKSIHGSDGLRNIIDRIIQDAKPVEIEVDSSEDQTSGNDEKLLPATPFPLDVFPENLQTLIHKISHCYQVEPSMVASIMVPLIGGAVGNAIRVSPKIGWCESPFIWMAIIADTGHGKSPVIKALTKPIVHLQGRAQQEYRDELTEYDDDLRKFNSLKKSDQAFVTPPDKPTLHHYMVSDSTVEALASVFEVTPRGVNIIWDELSGWLKGLDQYKGKAGNDRQHFLSLWNPEPWKIDRKTTGSKFIQNTGASILGGIQPLIIPKVLGNDGFDDGFIPRFLLLYTGSETKTFTMDGIDDTDIQPWEDLIEFCYSQTIEINDAGFVKPKIVILSEDALYAFKEFYNHCHSITPYLSRKARVFPPKLISYSLRLMGVLHVMDCFSDGCELHAVITPEIAEKAIRLTKFYAGQAVKALKLYGKQEDALDEYQKRLIETLYQLQDQVENGKLPLKKIVDAFNNGLPETAKLSRKRIGAMIRKDFELATKKSTDNLTVLVWETTKLQKLFKKKR
jgi:hypothetical protein